MMADDEGVIFPSGGSPPSGAHGGGWEGLGKDGGELALCFFKPDVSLKIMGTFPAGTLFFRCI